PKASYLLFNYQNYLQRVSDVSKHDASGSFFVSSAFWNNLSALITLLFKTQIDLKWFLPEDPLLPPLYILLLLVGLGVALSDWRRPEHLLVLIVSGLTMLANVMAYTMDYRFTNWMPVLFLMI